LYKSSLIADTGWR